MSKFTATAVVKTHEGTVENHEKITDFLKALGARTVDKLEPIGMSIAKQTGLCLRAKTLEDAKAEAKAWYSHDYGLYVVDEQGTEFLVEGPKDAK